MNRISIDVTQQEHERLKALAASQGFPIEEYILNSALHVRVRRAGSETIAPRSINQLFDSVCRPRIMSNNWYAAFLGVIAICIGGFGAYHGMMYLMGFGIMLPVIASLFPLPGSPGQ